MGNTVTIFTALAISLVVRVLLASLIGAVLLRLVCRLLPPRRMPNAGPPAQPQDQEVAYVPPATAVDENDSPYRAPQAAGPPLPARSGRPGQPYLSFGKAWAIVFIASLINVFGDIVLTVWASRTVTPGSMATVTAGGSVVVYAISMVYLLRFMVPTDWGRAASITLAFVAVGLLLLFFLGLVGGILMFFAVQ